MHRALWRSSGTASSLGRSGSRVHLATPVWQQIRRNSQVSIQREDGSIHPTPEHRHLPRTCFGPSSSHTVGPMRAGKIFINDLRDLGLLDKVKTVKINLHHTPQAILLGLEGSDPETIDTGTIPSRYEAIVQNKTLLLNGQRRIEFNMDRDMVWRWDLVLKTHSNGMRFSVFDENGDMLATNEYFSVGGGFVVNDKTKVDENLFYKGVDKKRVHGARMQQSVVEVPAVTEAGAPVEQASTADPAANNEKPPYPFDTAATLLALTHKHNKFFGYSDEDIHDKLMRIWQVMDECIHAGVSSTERTLPGRIGLRRRAPMLYRRLMRGFYPGISSGSHLDGIGAPKVTTEAIGGPMGSPNPLANASRPPSSSLTSQGDSSTPASGKRPFSLPKVVGAFNHPLLPMPPTKTTIPAVDFLSCYAIAVNEVNAAGGRIVTSPTNGAAGVIPGVLKYILEFVSDDPEKSIKTFLLTASAVGMLFKRGSTISAAEGGCQAEVGVACSMASAGFAACMGASPETVLQAAEIGIEHNLGLTCDPIDGLVQVPCIERNSLGAVKAITAAQLSMASHGVYSVSLDEAIEAMRLTAADMSVKYKETSLSTTVKIPLSVPAC
ncbi:L-serine dehydratase [Coprinopsis sp. MPI-PUGE-AT-0042]|nr:L-serine dehydratase [Coprinopsis sp. MPI-PUGE-AT-0042]